MRIFEREEKSNRERRENKTLGMDDSRGRGEDRTDGKEGQTDGNEQ